MVNKIKKQTPGNIFCTKKIGHVFLCQGRITVPYYFNSMLLFVHIFAISAANSCFFASCPQFLKICSSDNDTAINWDIIRWIIMVRKFEPEKLM